MKNKIKAVCAGLVLALTLTAATGCLGETPVEEVTVVAEQRLDGKLIYTEYSDGTAELTGYDGTLTELILPDTVNGLALVSIASTAFANETTLTTLRCGANITRIGDEAFYHCTALETVEIGETVTDIGYYAFEDTPWMAAQREDFVIAGDGVLLKYQGGATNVVIPDTVKRISDAFFQNETIVEVTLGQNVDVLGAYAFAYCNNLRTVHVNASLRVIGESAFAFCDNLRAIQLGPNVTELGPYAFYYCTMLRRADLGEALVSIGNYAFDYCNHLTSIKVGPALQSIGEYAFYECYILGGVTYAGSADDWAGIAVAQGNTSLTDAALRCLGK